MTGNALNEAPFHVERWGADGPVAMSVAIPAHGRTSLLREALDSLGVQTSRDFEVVVSDDAPTAADRAETRRLVKAFALRSGLGSVYLGGGSSLGIARNTNQALRAATGTFVRQLHTDDLLAPMCIEREIEAFSTLGDDWPAVFHHPTVFSSGEQPLWAEPALCLVQPRLYVRDLYHSATPLPSGMVVRRSFLLQFGLLDERLRFLLDWEYFGRFLTKASVDGQFVALFSGGLVGWRDHSAGVSAGLWDIFYAEHLAEVHAFLRRTAGHRDLWRRPQEVEDFAVRATSFRTQRMLRDAMSEAGSASTTRNTVRLAKATLTAASVLSLWQWARKILVDRLHVLLHRLRALDESCPSPAGIPRLELDGGPSTRQRDVLDVYPYVAFEATRPGAWLRVCVDYSDGRFLTRFLAEYPDVARRMNTARVWIRGAADEGTALSALALQLPAATTLVVVADAHTEEVQRLGEQLGVWLPAEQMLTPSDDYLVATWRNADSAEVLEAFAAAASTQVALDAERTAG